MKQITIILFAIIIAFASCKKDKKNVDPAPVVSTITQNITTNTTWTTGSTYIIDGTVNIDGATLTIQHGTTVKFKEGAYINVGNSSSGSAIIAVGTAAAPIIFTSYSTIPTAGDWNGIFFEDGTASTTRLSFCNFIYSGGYSSSYGTINLDGCNISMDNCTITNGENFGITVSNDAEFSSFTNNSLSNIQNHLIKLYPNSAHTIGAGNVFVPTNSSLGILIKGGTYDKAEETWLNQGVSYVIDGTVNIQSNAGCILNIQEGTTIAFTSGSYINVANSSGTYGTIKAIGTDVAPITFTSSAVSKTAGDWGCIFLEDGTSADTKFDYCTFEYGGGYSSSYGMVNLSDCSAAFTNCSFTNSLTYGITLGSDAWFTDFNNNSFASCTNHLVKIYANYTHTIGTGNTYNSSLGILVSGDTYEQNNETWKKQSCAYYIDGTVNIQSNSGSTLTIEAGTKVYFTQGSYINVGNSSGTYGKLVAQGTPTNRIIFSSAAPAGSASAGDWGCIFFENGTSAGTIIDNCDLSYGGGYSSSYGMIDINNNGTNVTVSNCNLSYSQSHGISVDVSTASPILTNNVFSNIAGEDVHNY